MPVDSIQVVVLYADPRGPYPKLVGSEYCWAKGRDARSYNGPWPVVAHPPCHLWTNLAAVNFKRYGGEHNRPGNDDGCFASALASVRRCGGVLEHPAFSKAWDKYGLWPPSRMGWQGSKVSGEWVCEVWQSAYGHKARKRTWLFWKGIGTPPELRWLRSDGKYQVGWFDRIKPTLSKVEASRTPILFARELVRLAQVSRIKDRTK